MLDWLADRFPKHADLDEKQVNAIIQANTATLDHANFRRFLVETGRLCRTPYGDRYWRP